MLERPLHHQSPVKHPLETVVMGMLEHHAKVDRLTLAICLSNPDPQRRLSARMASACPNLGIPQMQAYLGVAADVLDWLHREGKVSQGADGYYRLWERG